MEQSDLVIVRYSNICGARRYLTRVALEMAAHLTAVE